MIRRLFTKSKNGNRVTYFSKLADDEIDDYIKSLEEELKHFNALMRGLRDEIKCAKTYRELSLRSDDE